MKRLLFTFLFSLIITSSFAQFNLGKLKSKKKTKETIGKQVPIDKAKKDLEKAKTFLVGDICNYQGISWVKSALKRNPNSEEAKKILSDCNKYKYNQAVEILKSDPNNSKSMAILEDLIDQEVFNTEEANYLLALGHLHEGVPNHYVEHYIDKAISFNQKDLDYRWMRVRCNFLSNSLKEDDFSQAISDLNFMIENGVKTAKVYNTLAIAEKELATYLLRFKKAKKNISYTDDKTEYIKNQTDIYNNVITHFEASISAKKQALELGYTNKTSGREVAIKDLELDIIETKKSINNLSKS